MADAFIVIGKRPDHYKKMYDVLNELILFGGSGCSNERKLVMALIKDKKVPILELAYPTTRNDLINVIDRANDFLKNLTSINGIVNEDNLDADLKKHEGSLGASRTAATVLPLSRQLCGQPLLREERGGAGSSSYHRGACAHQSAEAQGIYGGSGGLLGRYAVRGGISLEYRTG